MGRRSQDNQIDWELIEKEFRLGQSTLRQLAAAHKVQPSAISRKANKEQWVQDKRAEVKALSEAQLLVSNTLHVNVSRARIARHAGAGPLAPPDYLLARGTPSRSYSAGLPPSSMPM